jgi:hypothetical protein
MISSRSASAWSADVGDGVERSWLAHQSHGSAQSSTHSPSQHRSHRHAEQCHPAEPSRRRRRIPPPGQERRGAERGAHRTGAWEAARQPFQRQARPGPFLRLLKKASLVLLSLARRCLEDSVAAEVVESRRAGTLLRPRSRRGSHPAGARRVMSLQGLGLAVRAAWRPVPGPSADGSGRTTENGS